MQVNFQFEIFCCVTHSVTVCLKQMCTNPGHQVALAAKLCTWSQIFVYPQYVTCCMSPFLCPEFWCSSQIFGMFVHPLFETCHMSWVCTPRLRLPPKCYWTESLSPFKIKYIKTSHAWDPKLCCPLQLDLQEQQSVHNYSKEILNTKFLCHW